MRKKCIVVLICLLMFGNLTHGAILCFGEDGHVSLEISSTNCCDEYQAISVQTPQNSCSIDNHSKNIDSCGDCVDIPIPGNCPSKQLASIVTKDYSHLKILQKTIISISNIDSISNNKEPVAILVNHLSDTIISISTTVLIV